MNEVLRQLEEEMKALEFLLTRAIGEEEINLIQNQIYYYKLSIQIMTKIYYERRSIILDENEGIK